MCHSFVKNGQKVTLLCKKPSKKIEDVQTFYGIKHGFNVQQISTVSLPIIDRFLYAFKVMFLLHKLLKANKHNEVILYGRDVYTMSMLAFLNMFPIPMIFEVHAPPANNTWNKLLKQIFSFKYFKHLIVISEALQKEYLKLFGALLDINQIIVAHDAVDLAQVPEIMFEEDSYQQKAEVFKVGYIGSLYSGKGMEIISEIASQMPDIEFHIVGGSQEQINKWKQSSSRNNMIFYGFVRHEQIFEYMYQFDILLAPYQKDVIVGSGTLNIGEWMSPLKIFEYMGAARPMIASDLTVLREVLVDGKNCFLVEPSDFRRWKEKIEYLRNNLQERKRIGKNALNDVLAHYTWEKRALRVLGDFSTTA